MSSKEIQAEIQACEVRKEKLTKELRHALYRETGIEVVYSQDRKYFYVHDPRNLAREWMAVTAIPGPVARMKRENNIVGWLEVKHDDGRVWHREVLSFTFWDLKSGDREKVNEGEVSEMVADYLSYAIDRHKWQGYERTRTL